MSKEMTEQLDMIEPLKKKRRKRKPSEVDKLFKQSLRLDTELSRAALFEHGIQYRMYDEATRLEERRPRTPRYVV